MRWTGQRGSDNLEDRRRSSGGKRVALGGGLGGLLILLVVWLLGGNPSKVLGLLAVEDQATQQAADYQPTAEEDNLAQFVSVVLASTEDVWTDIFKQMGKTYIPPKLVLYHRTEQSPCGLASQATGPFYCPGDQKVYLDLSFYEEMKSRLGGGGDFAFAYVIAHEIGHHVQQQLGTMDKVNAFRGRVSEKEFNAISVKLELQADFYAGVWANHTKEMFSLDASDIDEALNTATAIGDDRLQEQAQGYVVPDSFTHGTSKQRKYWFYRGYETGNIGDGDTFSVDTRSN